MGIAIDGEASSRTTRATKPALTQTIHFGALRRTHRRPALMLDEVALLPFVACGFKVVQFVAELLLFAFKLLGSFGRDGIQLGDIRFASRNSRHSRAAFTPKVIATAPANGKATVKKVYTIIDRTRLLPMKPASGEPLSEAP